MDSYQASLEAATRLALEFLNGLDSRPVAPAMQGAEIRARLDRPLSDHGIDPEQVIAELAADADPGILASTGGRFFAWVIGGALPSALAADWLASTWDQNATLAASGPSAAMVEEIAGAWLKEILGLPAESSFAFVTGCQMAHVTCLAAARHSLLKKCNWDVEDQGLFGAPRLRILSSGQHHGSFERAGRLLGFGSASFEFVAADSEGRMDPDALDIALTKRNLPTVVLLQAGEINTGMYDPFDALIPIAHQHEAWVHVDGAFGLWAAASPRFRHLLRGVSLADSWATDGHKSLNLPFDSGYAFVRDAESHRAAMSHRASYLVHDAELRDQIDWTPEWSRRARGFSTYAALRQLGRHGVTALIEQLCDHARALVDGIGHLSGVEVLCRPVVNQGLVRFPDRDTDQIIAAINATGEAYFGGVTWRGQRAMRVSVCNARTTDADVARAIRAVASVLSVPT